ncbi:hypothetical protein BV898_08896 [Hypsibius exemplaris]|uniref:Uncharacterized protein n=1 Tax=Hypsibius exemplaris TaxID=2072580 RepID=A0A1W0WPA5_HYPEX|nr:hypothetical protein BV898_08896 [Hypsibius exemplaris]
MSVRKRYLCCDQSVGYIEKRYPIEALRDARRTEEILFGGDMVLDDGLEDAARPRPPTDTAILQYSLNKRGRWRIIATLNDLILHHHHSSLSSSSGEETDQTVLPVSCVVRKFHTSDRYHRLVDNCHAHAQNVVAVASTVFDRTNVMGNKRRKNKTSTLSRFAEKGCRPRTNAEQAPEMSHRNSKHRERHSSHPAADSDTGVALPRDFAGAAALQAVMSGVVYEIGMNHNLSSHFYRKDRHNPGSRDRFRWGKKSLKKSKGWMTRYGQSRPAFPDEEIAAWKTDRNCYDADDCDYECLLFDRVPRENLDDGAPRMTPAAWSMEQLINQSSKVGRQRSFYGISSTPVSEDDEERQLESTWAVLDWETPFDLCLDI